MLFRSYLIITTTQFFDNTEFKIGDTIQCKDYSFHNTDYDETHQFNQFIKLCERQKSEAKKDKFTYTLCRKSEFDEFSPV